MNTLTDCTKCGKTYQAASEMFAKEADRLCNPCITAWAETQPCPDCGKGPIMTTMKEDDFQYGSGKDAVMLPCTSPLRTCTACNFQFFDYEMEHTHLMAMNKHLVSIGQKPYQQ